MKEGGDESTANRHPNSRKGRDLPFSKLMKKPLTVVMRNASILTGSRESRESTSLVFCDVLPEHRPGPVAVGDIKRCRAQGRVLGYAGRRRRGLPEDRGGVLGDLDKFGGYHSIEPEEVAEHLFKFFIRLHA